jgi:hypothetical protein
MPATLTDSSRQFGLGMRFSLGAAHGVWTIRSLPAKLAGAMSRTQYWASVLAIGDVIEYDPENCNGCFG